MACVEEKTLPTLVDGVQVYNDGNPIPPGTQASITCCLCCHSPGIAYSGIPEGTTRVPEAELSLVQHALEWPRRGPRER